MKKRGNMTETIGFLFDKAARDYDRMIAPAGNSSPALMTSTGPLLEVIPYERDAEVRVLDLGAGTGLLSALIAEACPRARLTLVDVSERMLGVARERFSSS